MLEGGFKGERFWGLMAVVDGYPVGIGEGTGIDQWNKWEGNSL